MHLCLILEADPSFCTGGSRVRTHIDIVSNSMHACVRWGVAVRVLLYRLGVLLSESVSISPTYSGNAVMKVDTAFNEKEKAWIGRGSAWFRVFCSSWVLTNNFVNTDPEDGPVRPLCENRQCEATHAGSRHVERFRHALRLEPIIILCIGIGEGLRYRGWGRRYVQGLCWDL